MRNYKHYIAKAFYLGNAIFTMIELLFVISIIVILASILLPSLQKARQSVQSINCASNLKQIGHGVTMYTNDFNDVMPVYRMGSIYWVQMLMPYIPGHLFVCPSSMKNADPQKYANLKRITDPLDSTLYTNIYYIQSMGINVFRAYKTDYVAKVNIITNPTTLIYSADTGTSVEANLNSYKSFENKVYPEPCSVYPRHFNGANILFSDMHIDKVHADIIRAWGVAEQSTSVPQSHFRMRPAQP